MTTLHAESALVGDRVKESVLIGVVGGVIAAVAPDASAAGRWLRGLTLLAELSL